MFSSAVAVAAVAGLAAAKTIDIGVGDGGLVFKPNSTTAAEGDVLAFHFYPRMHSVVEGSYDNACQPKSNNAVFSGYYSAAAGTTNGTVFTVPVNNTQPIWFYCSEAMHCQSGMVMVVNPPSGNSQTLEGYAANAKKATSNKGLDHVQGGQAVANARTNGTSTTPGAAGATPGSSSSSSPSAGAGAATTGSPTGTTAGAATGSARPSTGAAAMATGMGVVGGAVVAGLAALL